MCGIAGLFQRGAADQGTLLRRARAMGDALAHRGPDGSGEWADAGAGLALAHRRLAIIALGPDGAQPMLSVSDRFAVTYNGELYNYRAVRDALAAQGVPVRGDSDTAVLLEACAHWGIEAALPRLDGMFALALWDRRDRRLWLVRDHAGIKPLAWIDTGGAVLFGSELGAIEAAGSWSPEIDPGAVGLLLRSGAIPAPFSVWRGVRKLPPGGIACFDMAGGVRESRWFDVVALAGATPVRAVSAQDAVAEVDAALGGSVRDQLVADVPVGAFLSGGVDSASVVAAMARAVPGAAHAFTIGFDDPAYDESDEAAAIAAALGVRHTVLRASAQDALALAQGVAATFDEPFADSSMIPTLLLSRLTRGHVTVALSGDGGDELFGGYRRHVLAARLWPRLARIPRGVRLASAAAIEAVPPGWWDAALGKLPGAPRRPGETLHKLASILGATDIDAAYARLTRAWEEEVAFHPSAASGPVGALPGDPLRRLRVLDLAGYLHDDVLTKVDRASMNVALEVRVPMLSVAMIRLALSLPESVLVRADGGKAVLRDALARHVPRGLFEREKTGFSIPLAAWLRGPLREWGEALIMGEALRQSGLVRADAVRRAWAVHQSGARDLAQGLWAVLMLAGWLEARGR